ncbi:hypothetical protein BDV93DRAFT_593982 [Ceratobasidium sp. AG-I]|nr:hypothetical protein BDV93DRAFT_593982 [Ceratobasidium sp. AG-I]
MATEYCGFDSLSPEVILRVLTSCRYDDIIYFASTSRRYYYLVHQSAALQLQMELEANGLELSDYAVASKQKSTNLLRQLYEYRDDWLYLRFGPPAHHEFTMNEFVQDVFQDALETYEIQPGNTNETTLHRIELATGARRSVTFETNFFNLQSDPSQNLAVLAEKNDLATISCSRDVWEDSSIPIQIMNDTLVLHLMSWGGEVSLNDHPAQVLICNWKSGQILNRILVLGSCAPRFLSPTSLMLLCKTQYHSDDVPTIELVVYENVQHPLSDTLPPAGTLIGDLSPLEPRFTFRFPTLSSTFALAKYSEPVWAAPGASTLHPTRSLFVPDPSCEILRIALFNVTEGGTSSTPFQVLVSKTQLLSHIASAKAKPENSAVVLSWKDWGERATRWIETEGSTAKRTIHGTRWVRLPEDGPQCINLLEFHGPTVRRFLPSSNARPTRKPEGDEELPSLMKTWSESEEATRVHTVVKPGILETPVFAYPIVSRLPYRVAISPNPVVLTGQDWRINGEHIIGTPLFFCGEWVRVRKRGKGFEEARDTQPGRAIPFLFTPSRAKPTPFNSRTTSAI